MYYRTCLELRPGCEKAAKERAQEALGTRFNGWWFDRAVEDVNRNLGDDWDRQAAKPKEKEREKKKKETKERPERARKRRDER